LVISLFLDNPSGGTVGLINASRFAGMAVGPMLATTVVAFSSLSSSIFSQHINAMRSSLLQILVLGNRPDSQLIENG